VEENIILAGRQEGQRITSISQEESSYDDFQKKEQGLSNPC